MLWLLGETENSSHTTQSFHDQLLMKINLHLGNQAQTLWNDIEINQKSNLFNKSVSAMPLVLFYSFNESIYSLKEKKISSCTISIWKRLSLSVYLTSTLAFNLYVQLFKISFFSKNFKVQVYFNTLSTKISIKSYINCFQTDT